MKKLFITLLFLSAACSKSKFGPSWNDVSVSEKALNESGCRFVETKKENSTETTKSLECDEAADDAAFTKQIEAMNSYIKDCNNALAIKNLRPTTVASLTSLKMQAVAKKISMGTKRAQIVAGDAQKAADDATEKVSKTMLNVYTNKKEHLASHFDATFTDGVISYSTELIIEGDGDMNAFTKALSEFIAAASAASNKTYKNVTDEQRVLMSKEAESAQEVIKKIEKTN